MYGTALLGAGVESVEQTTAQGTPVLRVRRPDGTSALVDPWLLFASDGTVIAQALRNEVRDQIDDFRFSQRNPSCAYCFDTEDLEADHVTPMIRGVAEWLDVTPAATYAKVFSRVPDRETDMALRFANPITLELENRALARTWSAWHRRFTSLQMLCRDCNRAKSARSGWDGRKAAMALAEIPPPLVADDTDPALEPWA